MPLTHLINTLGVQNRVQLTGALKDVESWYQKARIFAFPSSSEGFPNVVGEALAHGLPVVAFDCVAGPRDLIQQGINGFLADTYDFDRFAVYLKQLMDDEELRKRMASNAPDSVLPFQEEEIAQRFYQVMTSTV